MTIQELESKTDEELRVKCAELNGWVWYRVPKGRLNDRIYRCLFHPAIHECDSQAEAWLVRADGTEKPCNMAYMVKEGLIPNYPQSLDACEEFEKTLDVDILSGDSPRYTYARILYSIVPPDEQPFRAKPRLRTIAFIATKTN